MIDAMENAGQLPQFHLDSDRLINGFEAEATSAVHNNLSRDLGQRLTLHDQYRVLTGGSLREVENYHCRGSIKLSLNWRRPIHIADTGSGKIADRSADPLLSFKISA